MDLDRVYSGRASGIPAGVDAVEKGVPKRVIRRRNGNKIFSLEGSEMEIRFVPLEGSGIEIRFVPLKGSEIEIRFVLHKGRGNK